MNQAYKPLPSVRLLNEIFKLQNGKLVWRIDRGGKAKAGTLAGSPNKEGRLAVKVLGSTYYVHRIIWAIANESDPGNFQVDHIDGDHTNNNPSNLRLATHAENIWNRPARGYSWHKRLQRYQVKVTRNGKSVHIGTFKSKIEARNAYLAAIRQYHGEFACA